MSVSFTWEVLKAEKWSPSFLGGTSNDISILDESFPGRLVSTNDIPKLRAMALVSRVNNSLWTCIADKLESLQDGDYDHEVVLKIDTEF